MTKLTQYYDEFEVKQSSPIPFKYIKMFEKYIKDKRIQFNDMYNYVNDFIETLPLSKLAGNPYKANLRKYIEFVYEKEQCAKKDDKFHMVYILQKDGHYYLKSKDYPTSKYYPSEGNAI